MVERIEKLDALDAPGEVLSSWISRVVRPGPVEDTLSGVPLGHPAHPLLVAVPIGAWTSALLLDVTGADERATRQLVAVGTLAALPSAATGATDWLTTSGPERRVGLVHAAANATALVLQTTSWLVRRKGRRGTGVALSAAATTLVGVGGWLGGHLAYALGVGIDTTAFQRLPSEWTDAGAIDDVNGQPRQVEIDGVPIVLYRATSGVVAMADRCTHRGGPLHEGDVNDGCITCPWHGSVFAADGTVVSGPATRPQPVLEVRVQDGRVQVRRDEQRTLRTNPVGR